VRAEELQQPTKCLKKSRNAFDDFWYWSTQVVFWTKDHKAVAVYYNVYTHV